MLNKLSEKIYYLPNQDSHERPTLGLISGDKYSLVVDAGNSVQHANDFIQEIAKLDVPPVKFLVITHAHWDHFLGMNEFNALVIVNSMTNQVIKEWQNFSFDDHSLEQYITANKMSNECADIIKNEMPDRETFKLISPHLVFDKTLTLDLGNKICVLERISSTHTDDSTIVYVPDEKVLFLGDSTYGKTTNSLFHYKQSHLLPMIEDVRKYESTQFLLGHETICDLDEMELYFEELLSASNATESASLERAIESFEKEHHRSPNENELFFLKAFVNDQIIASQEIQA